MNGTETHQRVYMRSTLVSTFKRVKQLKTIMRDLMKQVLNLGNNRILAARYYSLEKYYSSKP